MPELKSSVWEPKKPWKNFEKNECPLPTKMTDKHNGKVVCWRLQEENQS
jgi:hypothetical protein